MKKAILSLLACTIFSISLILALYAISDTPNNHKNAFYRMFNAHKPVMLKAFDLKYAAYYIAGFANNHLYLGNSIATSELLMLNYDLTDTLHLHLYHPGITRVNWPRISVKVDSPHVYMMDGVAPLVLYAALPSLQITKPALRTPYFTVAQPLAGNSFVMVSYGTRLKENRLVKVMADSIYIPAAPANLESQGDGIFSVDGSLSYDAQAQKLVYVYLYRNQFLCLDTSLTLIYKANTIDTTTTATIKVGKIQGDNEFELSTPPVFVNKRSCVNGGRIYIHSALMGNNENKKDFDKYTAVDVYSLKDGFYQSSFAIPDYKQQKIRSFRVAGNRLFVLYEHYLCTYRIDL